MGLFKRRSSLGDPLLPAYVRDRTETGDFEVTVAVSGFGTIPIPWDAGSADDAAASFVEFLNDELQVIQLDAWSVPAPGWRRVRVSFRGSVKELVFRPDWVAAFTVERG